MKILEIATGYTPVPAKIGAATEIVVEELGKSFVGAGVDIAVVDISCPSRPATVFDVLSVSVPSLLRREDLTLGVFHKLKRVGYSIACALKLGGVLSNASGKVVLHFHNQYNFYFYNLLVPRRLRAKAVSAYTVHSYIWNQPWPQIEGIVRKKYFMEIDSVKKADLVFVLNPKIQEVLEQRIGIDGKRLRLLPNGVNGSVYRPLPKSSGDVPSDGPVLLVHAGSVCPRKNQLGIVKALTPLLRSGECRFAYAGGVIDAGYQAEIGNYCRDQGIEAAVSYRGELSPGEELNRFYNEGSGFIFDSTSEAFSLVILEAMAAGLPVLLNAREPIPVLAHDEDGVLYFDPQNLLATIRERIVVPTSRSELSRKALATIQARFSWDYVAGLYHKEFHGFNKLPVDRREPT